MRNLVEKKGKKWLAYPELLRSSWLNLGDYPVKKLDCRVAQIAL